MRVFAPLAAVLFTIGLSGPAFSQSCGNTSSGFNTWKAAFAKEAKRAGVKSRGLKALAATTYAKSTIAADRNQKSFKYSLEKFMKVRGANTIIAQGRKRKAKNAAFYASLEKRYGVATLESTTREVSTMLKPILSPFDRPV